MILVLGLSLVAYQVSGLQNDTFLRGQCDYRRNRPGFECDNGDCIDEGRVCDKRPDCPDGSDETVECCAFPCFTANGAEVCVPDTGRNSTEANEGNCRDCTIGGYPGFRCDDGQCIYKRKVCDKRPQCKDGSDETHCDFHQCLSEDRTEVNVPRDLLEVKTPRDLEDKCRKCDYNSYGDGFRCDSGQCILYQWKCDGTSECLDGSDEKKEVCNPETEEKEETENKEILVNDHETEEKEETENEEILVDDPETEDKEETENKEILVNDPETEEKEETENEEILVDDPETEEKEETEKEQILVDEHTCPPSWECKKFSQCETFENFLEAGGIFRKLRCNPEHLSWICCDPEGLYKEFVDIFR